MDWIDALGGRFQVAALILALFGGGLTAAFAGPLEPVLSLAQKEKAPFLDTLKGLVSILASPTTSKASPSSCTPWRCSRR